MHLGNKGKGRGSDAREEGCIYGCCSSSSGNFFLAVVKFQLGKWTHSLAHTNLTFRGSMMQYALLPQITNPINFGQIRNRISSTVKVQGSVKLLPAMDGWVSLIQGYLIGWLLIGVLV